MSRRIKVPIELLIIQISRYSGVGMCVRNGCWPANQQGDGTVEVVEHRPRSATDFNLPFVDEVEDRTVTVET